MRVKTILSLTAFAATFALSVLLIGLPKDNFYSKLTQLNRSEQNRQNIKALLWQDINNGRTRNRDIYQRDEFESSADLTTFAEAVEEYVDNSQSIDDSNLPADFQAAWHTHMNAWREHSDFLNAINTNPAKNSAVDGFADTPFTLNDHDQRTYSAQSNEINRTWYDVLRIGRKYGVYVPVE